MNTKPGEMDLEVSGWTDCFGTWDVRWGKCEVRVDDVI